MEVDGMHRDDCRNAACKTRFRLTQARLDRKIRDGSRLKLYAARNLQNLVTVEVGRSDYSRPVLCHANSMLRPRAVSIVIGTVSGGAGRTRQRRKHLGECSNGLAN